MVFLNTKISINFNCITCQSSSFYEIANALSNHRNGANWSNWESALPRLSSDIRSNMLFWWISVIALTDVVTSCIIMHICCFSHVVCLKLTAMWNWGFIRTDWTVTLPLWMLLVYCRPMRYLLSSCAIQYTTATHCWCMTQDDGYVNVDTKIQYCCCILLVSLLIL